MELSFISLNSIHVTMVLSLATVAEEDDYLTRMHASFDRMEQLLVAFAKSHGLPIPTFRVRPSTNGLSLTAEKEMLWQCSTLLLATQPSRRTQVWSQ